MFARHPLGYRLGAWVEVGPEALEVNPGSGGTNLQMVLFGRGMAQLRPKWLAILWSLRQGSAYKRRLGLKRQKMRLARTENDQDLIARRIDEARPAGKSVTGMQNKKTRRQRNGHAGTVLGALLLIAATGGAWAFDGQPAQNPSIGPKDLSPTEALRAGARQYYSGDKSGALTSLQYAAENGQSMAAWKLGEMYAKGDGVKEDDLKAFQYYSQIVRDHGDDRPNAPDAPFVASALVALGSYYLSGIDGSVPKNETRARQIFTHAASYFGDADAQFELGRLYQDNNSRMAIRWYNLAALKGHVGAQARLGETLYSLGTSDKKKARGLMWMTVAREQATGTDAGWIHSLHEQYFAVSPEPVREIARSLADGWLKQNRPDMIAAQQAPVQ